MPTAFVTGGSGFIGGAVVRRLVAEGVGVRVLARSDASARAVRAAGVELVSGDFGDPRAMALGADGCDVAFHCGRFAWVGGGHHRTATTHVDNAVHGLLLAARATAPGPVYFATDGKPVVFREFVTRLLGTHGLRPPRGSLPRRVAGVLAAAAEAAWRALPLPGRRPLTRRAVWLSGLGVTIDISRARTELGYAPVRTVDEGLAELADEARRGPHR